MARKRGGKRLTLSEHLALRKQAAEASKAREQERQRTIDAFKKLDSQVLCNCPACLKRRSS